MSGYDNLVIKANLTDRTGRSTGQNDEMIAVLHLRVVGVHGVDLAEAGEVAVLDVDAGDVIFALSLGLGAVILEVMDGGGRDAQTGALPLR